MPLRSELLSKRWSTFDLPILPFLVPRVFAPWPPRDRRAHSGTQVAQKPNTYGWNDGNWPKKSEDGGNPPKTEEFLLRRLGARSGAHGQKHLQGLDTRPEDERPSVSGDICVDIPGLYGMSREPIEAPSKDSGLTADAEFRRKYEEIWGNRTKKPSLRSTLQPERRVGKDEDFLLDSGPQSLRTNELRLVSISKDTPRIPNAKDLSMLDYQNKISGRQRPRRAAIWSLLEQQRALNRRRLGAINQRRVSDIPKTRAKFVRWSPGPVSNFSSSSGAWHRRFAVLNLRHEKFMKGRRHPKMIMFIKEESTEAFRIELIGSDSSISLNQIWRVMPEKKRMQIWPELMITALGEYPTKALKVLAATYTEPYPPSYAVSDSLDYIISYYLRNRKNPNLENAMEIFATIEHFLRFGPLNYFHLSQSSVYLLLTNLDQAHAKRLFGLLTEFNHPLHRNTLMQFASKLGQLGETDERFEILKSVKQKGGEFNSPEISSLCATLLQRKNRPSSVIYSDSEIFEFMLECGMKPNIVIYNILLQNSLEGGDHETGWQIHDMMMENGIEADAYTYSILLSDAKLRMDQSSIGRVMSIVKEKEIRNAHIVTDILHAIFLLHQDETAALSSELRGKFPTAFETMLSVYCEYFHLEPLARIIPWVKSSYPDPIGLAGLSKSELAAVSAKRLMDPPAAALVVMLTGLLHGFTEPQFVKKFYNHFCNLVMAGDPATTELTKSTHVYNIVLLSLGKFRDTLGDCPRLIGDMLSTNAETISVMTGPSLSRKSEESKRIPQIYGTGDEEALQNQSLSEQNHREPADTTIFTNTNRLSSDSLLHQKPASEAISTEPTPHPHRHPKPDIFTWSILLRIFIDHRQARAAEKVLAMMKSRGVTPNQVTWNSLALGYARMQDTVMAVDTINRLEKAGFEADEVTMKGLTWIENRRALIEAMRAKEDKSIRKTSALEGKALNALKKTLRMIADDKDLGAVDGGKKREAVEAEILVRDIERREDKAVDADG